MIDNIDSIIKFARLVGKNKLALDVFEYLINNNGEFNGSYRTLAEEVTSNGNNASNIRKAVMKLVALDYVKAQSNRGNDDFCTHITINKLKIYKQIKR